MEDGGWRMKMEAEGERERGKEGLRRRHSRQGGEDERQRQNPPSQTHHNRNNKLLLQLLYRTCSLLQCFYMPIPPTSLVVLVYHDQPHPGRDATVLLSPLRHGLHYTPTLPRNGLKGLGDLQFIRPVSPS